MVRISDFPYHEKNVGLINIFFAPIFENRLKNYNDLLFSITCTLKNVIKSQLITITILITPSLLSR